MNSQINNKDIIAVNGLEGEGTIGVFIKVEGLWYWYQTDNERMLPQESLFEIYTKLGGLNSSVEGV